MCLRPTFVSRAPSGPRSRTGSAARRRHTDSCPSRLLLSIREWHPGGPVASGWHRARWIVEGPAGSSSARPRLTSAAGPGRPEPATAAAPAKVNSASVPVFRAYSRGLARSNGSASAPLPPLDQGRPSSAVWPRRRGPRARLSCFRSHPSPTRSSWSAWQAPGPGEIGHAEATSAPQLSACFSLSFCQVLHVSSNSGIARSDLWTAR